MLRMIRIWWFIRLLQRDCIHASGDRLERSHVHRMYIPEIAFLERAARRAVHPHKPYGICNHCGNDTRKEIDKKYSRKVARKMNEYSILLELCKEKGYLDTLNKKDEETAKLITLIHPSNKASEIMGIMDLTEILLKQYKLTWTLILIPIITFLIGITVGTR